MNAIMELFARRQPAYRDRDVLRLLRLSEEAFYEAIRSGVLTMEVSDAGEQLIPWEDVATLALEQWTPRMIAEALGKHAPVVLPPLNQHHTIRVSLPAYLVRYLDYCAGKGNASDIIERILHEHAAQDAAALEVVVPGFQRALEYPYYIPRPGTAQRCVYCGLLIRARREVCRACTQRHKEGT